MGNTWSYNDAEYKARAAEHRRLLQEVSDGMEVLRVQIEQTSIFYRYISATTTETIAISRQLLSELNSLTD